MNFVIQINEMELIQRLQACLKLETLAEEIYLSLCKLFPGASELFRLLAEEEARHADILTISAGFHKIGELPDEIVPDSMPQIKRALNIAGNIKERIDEKPISLRGALELSLDLEMSLAENYFNEIMSKKMDSEVISYLKKFYKDERSHADRIKNYMTEKGYSIRSNLNRII